MTEGPQSNPVLKDLEEWGYPPRAAVVIRHSERNDSAGWPLSPRGHELAVALGRGFGVYREVRAFHSPALRCEQTAIDISQGAVEAGSVFTDVRPERVLGFSYLLDGDRPGADVNRLPEGFLRNWISGRLDPALVQPLDVKAQQHLALVLRTLSEAADEPRLDVFVTHELNVLMMEEGVLGIRHDELGNPEILDGVTFRLDHGDASARYRNRIRRGGLSR
ncbi:MAG: histidine phosphatase family protein [Thermoplasmata archaeon]